MTERVQGPESRPGDPESGWVRMMVRATLPFIMHKFHHINDNISGTIIICFRWIAFQCMLFYVFIQMSFDIFFVSGFSTTRWRYIKAPFKIPDLDLINCVAVKQLN